MSWFIHNSAYRIRTLSTCLDSRYRTYHPCLCCRLLPLQCHFPWTIRLSQLLTPPFITHVHSHHSSILWSSMCPFRCPPSHSSCLPSTFPSSMALKLLIHSINWYALEKSDPKVGMYVHREGFLVCGLPTLLSLMSIFHILGGK
jgi:hypothetical protein